MTDSLVGDSRDDFIEQAARYRPELLAHCYRMLGSRDDAEDLVQETYLRAWRAYGGFEGRSSLRVWLYRIATTVCLSALEHRSRRFLPSGLGAPSDDPRRPLGFAGPEVAWLQPLPDPRPDAHVADPAAVVAERGSVRLALVAALQHLPARQRAVLILRDVLAWRAAEVAELLETSPAAVNSLLQRARAQLAAVAPDEEVRPGPLDPGHRDLLERYARAFADADVEGLLNTLRADVTFEMPPEPVWFAGRDAVLGFLTERVFPTVGRTRLVATTANGLPAFGVYRRDADGAEHAYVLQVLMPTPGGIAGITAFRDPGLFPAFGLPPVSRAV